MSKKWIFTFENFQNISWLGNQHSAIMLYKVKVNALAINWGHMSQVQQRVESTIFQTRRKNEQKINNCNANWTNISTAFRFLDENWQRRKSQKLQIPPFFMGLRCNQGFQNDIGNLSVNRSLFLLECLYGEIGLLKFLYDVVGLLQNRDGDSSRRRLCPFLKHL